MSRADGPVVGRIAGAPVRLSPSWALIAVAIVLLFGPQVRRALPALGAGAYGVAFGYALILAVSVLVHEIAHALVGRASGQRPDEIVLTLWGGHTSFRGAGTTPGRTLATALAGPGANLALAGVAWAAAAAVDAGPVAALLLEMTVWANLLLAAFNALPGAPLDGGRIVETAVWAVTGSRDRGLEAAGYAGRLVAVAIVAAAAVGAFTGTRRADPLLLALTVWVAVTLWQGAGRSLTAGRSGRAHAAVRLADLEVPAVGVVRGAPLSDAIDRAVGRAVVVLDRGRPVGIVDPDAVGRAVGSGTATPVHAVAVAVPDHAVRRRADLPAGGTALLAALLAPDTPDGPTPVDETPAWILTDEHGAVRSVVPRETTLAAIDASRQPRTRGARP